MSRALIHRDTAGRELTREDLGASWEKSGSSVSIPAEASALCKQGREAGARGDYAVALELLGRAARIATDWALPIYDIAFTYLLMDDPASAEAHYEQINQLHPRGFFTTKAFLDSLRRERAQTLPAGFTKAYALTESLPPEQKRALLQGIAQRFPNYPGVWKDLAGLLAGDDERLGAIRRGLDNEPDADTQGLLLINRALIGAKHGRREEAIRALGDLALAPQSTLSTEMLAKATLARLLESE